MYSLVWNRDGFTVEREHALPVEEHADIPLRSVRTSAGAVGVADWKNFVDADKVNVRCMDKVLKDSWKRCKAANVDPGPRKCWNFVPMDQLEPNAGRIRRLTADVERDVYAAIKGRDLLITITDPEGHVVRTCGDPSTLSQADKLNFGPGALWAESSVGTNAIGTALSSGHPVQIFGPEHYCQSHHAWSCSAAPFFDPHGNIAGCFDISGPVSSDHSRALELVLGAVRSLERQLFLIHAAELEHRSCSLVTAAFNSVLSGTLSVDCGGVIADANSAAETLLGCRQGSLRGQSADSLFEYGTFLAWSKDNNQGTMPLRCRRHPNLMARATPMYSLNGTWVGTVIVILEPQRSQACRTPEPPATAKGSGRYALEDIIGQSPLLRQAVQLATRVARTPSTVLINGESGTGKELFAQGIHQAGPRAGKPFVALNCGAFSEDLIQSELFGYTPGSFTGADRKGRAGKFEQAHTGTLFLDEISEMPLTMQVNLLRAIEERQVTRIGAATAIPVDVKIIAATNRDLHQMVREGRFREDLYFRLNVINIAIPPLRDRGADVGLLAEFHASRLSREYDLPPCEIDPSVYEQLCQHSWPGNVRELVNVIEHALNVMTDSVMRPEHLPAQFQHSRSLCAPLEASFNAAPCGLREREADAIREALDFHQHNISRTAKALGIGRNTLYAKMRKFGLQS